MKVICKSITEVHSKDAKGTVRTEDVELLDEHGKGTGKHERKPIVERVEVQLADESGKDVAMHILAPGEKHDFVEGKEYKGPHTYEHAPVRAAS